MHHGSISELTTNSSASEEDWTTETQGQLSILSLIYACLLVAPFTEIIAQHYGRGTTPAVPSQLSSWHRSHTSYVEKSHRMTEPYNSSY
jgi:hypothetical protein